MKLLFRQGIVRYPVGIAGTPTFIQKNGSDNSYIDLNIDSSPVQFTTAHSNANYIFTINTSVSKAWGPMPATGATQYLYWDVSLLDASLTYGHTSLPPYTNLVEPNNPQIDQHWFDLTNNLMKVWNGSKWLVKLRVFAGTYDHSAILTPRQIGSQVNITAGEYFVGNILLGKNNYPLRESDGTFVTSESNLIAAFTSGQDIKFDSTLIYGQASQYIPAFSLISYTAPSIISLASYMNTNIQVNGIIQTNAEPGEVVNITSHGLIVNQAWNWNWNNITNSTVMNIGKTLFCGLNGEVTLSPPPVGLHQPIGYVHDNNAIFLSIQTPTKL